MKVKSAEFVKSSSKNEECPKDVHPEYAFIGRSNVGKSSLINMLTDRKSLAKTSGTPGKTQLINHFVIDNNWHIVDLPGFGYAKVSKGERKGFQKLITDFLLFRKSLITVFLLVDSRHPPQKIDLEFMRWLGENAIPFSIVFTKIDKLTSNEWNKNLTKYKKKLLLEWEALPPIFSTSSTGKVGQPELLAYIYKLNETIPRSW